MPIVVVRSTNSEASILVEDRVELLFKRTRFGLRCVDRASADRKSPTVSHQDFLTARKLARRAIATQGEIPINDERLNRAVQEINKDIPEPHGLSCPPARAILERMNELRIRNYEFHSALQQAAAEEPGIGTVRAAFFRKVIALYGRWTYRAMKEAGIRGPDLEFWRGAFKDEPKMKNGAEVQVGTFPTESGQYALLK